MTKRKGQPFLFDHHVFDEDGQISLKSKGPPLEFTAPDMEAARKAAFEEGKKAGIAEGQAGMIRQILTVAQSIKQNTSLLFAAEDERKALFEAEAVHLTYCIIEKLFPVLNRKAGLEDLRARLSDIIQAGLQGRALKIEVPPTLTDEIRKYLDQEGMNDASGFNIVSSPALHGTECRVSWNDGGAIHEPIEIAGKILVIFQETLAAKGIPVHDVAYILSDPGPVDDGPAAVGGEGLDSEPCAPDGGHEDKETNQTRSVPKKSSSGRRSGKKKSEETEGNSGEVS